MPIYEYACDECGHEEEEYQGIHSDPTAACPQCRSETYHRVPTRTHTDMREYRTPISMFSIGLNSEEEIREFRQKCPDVDVCTDERDEMYGVPVARTRKQKLAALDAVGFEERG